MVKNLPAIQETWVRSLCQEDPLEKGMATYSNIIAWKIPWTEKPGRLLSIGSHRVGHDWSDLAYIIYIYIYIYIYMNLKKNIYSFPLSVQFSSVQSLSHAWLFVTPWLAAHQASLSNTNSQSSPKLMSIEAVMPSSHLILRRPLLLLPPIPPSIRVFSKESTLRMRWPKYWSFSFNNSPSNEHPGLISFRMDWLDLLAVRGTLKSLLQHHSSKASTFPLLVIAK